MSRAHRSTLLVPFIPKIPEGRPSQKSKKNRSSCSLDYFSNIAASWLPVEKLGGRDVFPQILRIERNTRVVGNFLARFHRQFSVYTHVLRDGERGVGRSCIVSRKLPVSQQRSFTAAKRHQFVADVNQRGLFSRRAAPFFLHEIFIE